MPTGYTAGLKKDTSFKDFTFKCARAFKALNHMEDAPDNAPITLPTKDNRYEKLLKEAKSKLDEFNKLSPTELVILKDDEERAEYAKQTQYNEEKVTLEEIYQSMFRKVRVWVPPTAEHLTLKKFMIQQLEESIKYDCTIDDKEGIYELSFDAWYKNKLEKLLKDIKFYSEKKEEYEHNYNEDVTWINYLLKSFE